MNEERLNVSQLIGLNGPKLRCIRDEIGRYALPSEKSDEVSTHIG